MARAAFNISVVFENVKALVATKSGNVNFSAGPLFPESGLTSTLGRSPHPTQIEAV